ncbi:uncharacterized protein LOC128894463, partial [Hylaeus anthracinus]|uniref:uncharacterized protein LOC128879912 n=1 Tax=Hylaeus volcanicus TaxID=313075 RepID=UPI0023B80076
TIVSHQEVFAFQVEGTIPRIVSRRVSKIPPIYERSTASNISFEKRGVFNVTKPCNSQPHPSSAFRGVRLGPPEEETSKMDTVPLLSPTMETELLKEPWIFPQSKLAIKEEKKPTSSIWEENFQDLSSWCMDTFQGQCDFRIGESPTFKLSGTKYEGNSALASEEGVLNDLMSVGDEDKWSIKMNTNEHTNSNCHSLQSTLKVNSKYEKKDSIVKSNTSDLWLRPPKETPTVTPTISATSWNKQCNTDASIPFQPGCEDSDDIHLDDACPTSFGSTETPRETWDVLQTVETIGSESFDLLSYLCDDEINSPDGSVSTDSSMVSSLTKSSTTVSQTYEEARIDNNESDTQSRTARSLNSSYIDTPAVSSRRSERKRTSVTSKAEKSYNRPVKRLKSERRRVEIDSSERVFASQYRESREKNNEASRKSRMNKKAKECEMTMKAMELERDNRVLKMKVEELEKLVTSMRSALLRSALKKDV